MRRIFLAAILLLLVSCQTYKPHIDAWEFVKFPAADRGSIKKLVGSESQFLKEKRNLYIYTPTGYEAETNTYPVIYFMDGNNLFSRFANRFSNWNLDLILDSLISQGQMPKVIIVGIGNTGSRTAEYVPYVIQDVPNFMNPHPQAENLLKYISSELKPFIDSQYRTALGRENTFVAGSSFGGLFSLYALLKAPEVFGGALAFSPSLWPGQESLFGDFQSSPLGQSLKLYIDMGGREAVRGTDFYSQGALERFNLLLSTHQPQIDVKSVFDPEAKHDEPAWTARLPDALVWMFAPMKL